MTFKFAGGAMRTIGGGLNDRGRGGFDRLRKFRQGQYEKHGGRMVHNAGGRVLEQRANMNDRLLGKASQFNPALGDGKLGRTANWARRRAYRAAAGTVGGYNVEAEMSARRAERQRRLMIKLPPAGTRKFAD